MLSLSVKADLLNENFLGDSTKELEEAFLEEMKKSWVREEDPGTGRGWKPRKTGGSWPLLYKTGKLQETARIFFDKRGGFTARVQPYGVYQNFHRRMFAVNDQLISKFEEILCQKILKKP